MSILHDPADERGQSPESGVTDAAWNAVAVASVAHREVEDALDRETVTFRVVLQTAQTYGLTVADLCWASGRDEASIRRLLTADE